MLSNLPISKALLPELCYTGKTTKDLFAKIRYIKQLLNTIKLIEDCVVSNSKSLYLKYSYSIGSTGSGLENKTLGKRRFPNKTPGETI